METCLPGRDLGRADLLVISVSPSLDTLEAILHPLWQTECARDALLQEIHSASEDPPMHGDSRRIPFDETLAAVPFVGQILRLDRVHTLKVERPGAAIAADDIAGVAACRTILIVVDTLVEVQVSYCSSLSPRLKASPYHPIQWGAGVSRGRRQACGT